MMENSRYSLLDDKRFLSLVRASTDGREQAQSIRSAKTCGKDGIRQILTARESSETCMHQA